MRRRVCIFIGSRANYSSIKSVMSEIKRNRHLELQVVLGASAVLERYGNVSKLIKKDGFKINFELNTLIEGSSPLTMAKSTGIGLIDISSAFSNLKPHIVITVGDRFETMSTVLAASYMNITLAHTMGGEVTGTIDESIRHAITKFANIHFPASIDAKKRIIKLGENREDVHLVGCPRIDLVKEYLKKSKKDFKDLPPGVGDTINTEKPFLLVSQHPVTTEYEDAQNQIIQTLKAVKKSNIPAIILWPNADAGTEDISREIRKWREKGLDNKMQFYKNLPIDYYVYLMKKTACLIGNSSSGIREGAFIGTPVINIGSRQNKRQRGKNVIDVSHNEDKIFRSILKQVKRGKYNREFIYGNGNAGSQIAKILSKCKLNIQKKIAY